jgi:hypothetical protein
METKCASRYEFRSTLGKHKLDGQMFTCELEQGHQGNHTAHEGETPIHWTNEQAQAA